MGDLTLKLLLLFIATDIGFVTLHLVHSYSELLSSNNFALQKDRGYSELFQYIKEYWISLSLTFLAIQKRSLLYFSWGLLFFYLLLDDALEIHESIGAFISNKLGLSAMFNLRAVDFGELLASFLVALFFLSIIFIFYRFADRLSRNVSKQLVKLLLALAFFGVVADMLHIAIQAPPSLKPLLIIIEDGGELAVMSTIACFVFSLFEPLQPRDMKLRSLEFLPRNTLIRR